MKLGINIDHIATLRNARQRNDPSLLEIMFEVQEGRADSITVHLREDRRHILDNDLHEIKKHSKLPLNLEIACSKEMLDIALNIKPKSVCFVPEKRQELTTEGGLNLQHCYQFLEKHIPQLQKSNILTFLFLEPDIDTLQKASSLPIQGVEIHTGRYSNLADQSTLFHQEQSLIHQSAEFLVKKNLKAHAGHGLNYKNISGIIQSDYITEVNIGHSIIARSLKIGIKNAVHEMKSLLS